MEWWEAFWLGLTQGITEFINFGALLALVIYYRKRIWQILKDVFVKHDLELATNIVITCIPAAILGVCVESHEYNTRLAMQIISKKYQAVRALLLLFSDSIMSLWQNLR